MSEAVKELIRMARAAERDDRLSTGALYGKLADAIERQHRDLVMCRMERDAAIDVSNAAAVLVEHYRSNLPPDHRHIVQH